MEQENQMPSSKWESEELAELGKRVSRLIEELYEKKDPRYSKLNEVLQNTLKQQEAKYPTNNIQQFTETIKDFTNYVRFNCPDLYIHYLTITVFTQNP